MGCGLERRDGQAAALQAGLYGVGNPPQASLSSRRRTAIKYYVGLDVAMKETAVCVVDDGRRIVREGKAATEPEGIAAFLNATGVSFERVGIEAGPLAPWLCDGLAATGLPVICIDARHATGGWEGPFRESSNMCEVLHKPSISHRLSFFTSKVWLSLAALSGPV
jgi:hypothetical protein